MKFWALVKKEFLVLGRDVHGLAVLFVMPAVFILIMSLALQDGFSRHQRVSVEFLLQNQSGEAVGQKLVNELKQVEGFAAKEVPASEGVAPLRRQVADDDAKFAVIVPADFAARLKGWNAKSEETPVQVLLSPAVNPQQRLLFEIAVNQALTKLRLETYVFPSLGLMAVGQGAIMAPAVPVAGEYVYRNAEQTARPTAVQQSVPAYLVFGMFFVVVPLSTAFLSERAEGTLTRLQMMNVSPSQLMAAKLVPYYLVNQVQMVLMVLVGMFVVPLIGGDALNAPHSIGGLLAISSAASLAAIGFALLIATLVRSATEATTVGQIANVILGVMGGVMVPKFIMPKVMQEATVISPMSWGLEGFLDVFLRGGRWVEVLDKVGALVIFGGVCLGLAAVLFHRRFRSQM